MNILEEKRVFILTLGCKVNQYESDAMYEAFFAAGSVMGTENDADICIINTCSVTNIADRKSRQMISRLKKENPNALIVATGCYVQAVANRISSERSSDGAKRPDTLSSGRQTTESFPDVDLIVGNNRKRDIVRLVEAGLSGREITDNVIDIAKDPEFEDLKVRMPEGHTRAYLKIQDGCNAFCAYCIIPFVRGRIRNKSITDIMDEVETLAASGVKEIVLTGINLSSFGDIGDLTLADVICRIHNVSGIERIRLSSLEPRIITDEFMERISRLPKVCPHFHLSLQSGCDTVLKRMNRRYTVSDIQTITERIRRFYDRPALTADIIVGFPGETEEEFDTTCRTAAAIGLYEAHVFPYSRRKGTVADRMDGQLTEAVKKDRVRRLMAQVKKQGEAYISSFRNDPKDVLIEEIVETPSGPCYRGHTERYLLLDIPIAATGDTDADPARINTIYTIV